MDHAWHTARHRDRRLTPALALLAVFLVLAGGLVAVRRSPARRLPPRPAPTRAMAPGASRHRNRPLAPAVLLLACVLVLVGTVLTFRRTPARAPAPRPLHAAAISVATPLAQAAEPAPPTMERSAVNPDTLPTDVPLAGASQGTLPLIAAVGPGAVSASGSALSAPTGVTERTGTRLPVPAPPALAAATPPAPVYYTVQPGDGLWLVAQRFGVTLAALAAANGLPATAELLIGQTLRIPQTGAER